MKNIHFSLGAFLIAGLAGTAGIHVFCKLEWLAAGVIGAGIGLFLGFEERTTPKQS